MAYTQKWSEEEVEYLLHVVDNHPEQNNFIYAEMLQKKFNRTFTFHAVRKKRKRLADASSSVEGKTVEKSYVEKFDINVDGSRTSDKAIPVNDEDQLRDADFLLKEHGFDKNEWELVSASHNIWNTNDKLRGIQTLYASKIKVKPRVNEYSLTDVRDVIEDLMQNYQPPIYKPVRYADNGRLLEFNISDLHLNKLGYKDGEYDHIQAEKAFFHIINDVLTRTRELKFEKILFIWSHDFFNIDSLTKTTTGGTPQDVSMRYSDMYKMGKRMLIQGIDLLRQVAPLETVQVGANHDRLTSYTMSEVLDAWYRNDDNVTIDNDPTIRKYRRFGKCLIGFSHGNTEKKRLGKIMPVEARTDWGETLYAEMHAGHFHSEHAVVEDNGVIVRYLSSPSGTDTWHFESGYVGAVKKCQSFIWDKELGLMDIIHTPIVK
ncbi:MAG: hypothetical protein R3328_00265 [Planococcaceae bacterium]|nr:hypothetical protein [Planococcaceae bacterium]